TRVSSLGMMSTISWLKSGIVDDNPLCHEFTMTRGHRRSFWNKYQDQSFIGGDFDGQVAAVTDCSFLS
ncbi:MAG: hypothetical protein ACKO9Q_14570, partial [Pirellula sp.]